MVCVVQLRAQRADGGGPVDRFEVDAYRLHLVYQILLVVWDGVNGIPCANQWFECLPLLFGFDRGELRRAERTISCTGEGNGSVRSGKPAVGIWVNDGVTENAIMVTMVEIAADVATAACFSARSYRLDDPSVDIN